MEYVQEVRRSYRVLKAMPVYELMNRIESLNIQDRNELIKLKDDLECNITVYQKYIRLYRILTLLKLENIEVFYTF